MVSETPKQIFEAIRRSSTPLLILPRGAGADGYASAVGFSKLIEGMGKKVEIVTADGATPINLGFLSGIEQIKPKIETSRHLIVELDTSKTSIQEMKQEKETGVSVFLLFRRTVRGAKRILKSHTQLIVMI